MNDEVILVRNVSKIFNIGERRSLGFFFRNSKTHSSAKKFSALYDVSFEVKKGEILGIIGQNGSGKTTLLRVIAGIYQPNTGSVQVTGRLAPLLTIGTGFRPEFAARDNIIISGMLYGLSKNYMIQKVDEIMKIAELEKFPDLKLKHYSTGMRARLAFCTSLQINPDVLLVDEILAVGDLKFREKSFELFLKYKKEGKTILYASHNLNALPKLCDRVILLHHGKIITIGTPDDVIKKYKEISKIKK